MSIEHADAWEAVCNAHRALEMAGRLVAEYQDGGPLPTLDLDNFFLVLLKAQRKALQDLAGVYEHGNYTCF